MRRRTGIAVIAAAAALGVVTAVVTGAHTGTAGAGTGPVARGGTSVSSSPSPSTTFSAPPTSTAPNPSTTSTAPSTSTTAATPTLSPSDTPAELSGVALGDVNLLRSDDFARAGWSTAALAITTRAGDGPGIAGTCQAQPLSSLPGGDGARSGSYRGKVTSASESAATFAAQREALAAYETVVEWFHQCGQGTLPGHLGRKATISPDMQVNLDTEFDRALWVRISGDGFDGTGGVVLVGRRVAVFFDQDADPATTTVGSLMTSVALRLTA